MTTTECTVAIERGTYAQARKGYASFTEQLAEGVEANETVSVIARFVGRAVDAQQWSDAWQAFTVLAFIWNGDPRMRSFVQAEIVKNLSQVFKAYILQRKFRMTSERITKDPELAQLIEGLTSIVYVGSPDGNLVKIQ